MSNEPSAAASPDGSDPSMEEILASIRRILSEDEAEAGPANESDDVLVLDQSMIVEPEPAATAEPPNPMAEPSNSMAEAPSLTAELSSSIPEPPSKQPVETPRKEPELMPPPEAEQSAPASGLVAPEAAAAAATAMGSLVRTLSAERATQVYSGGPTLEDVVRAELRPLLKQWLDTNLPPLVERLVRAEIERVAGRAVP